MKYTEKDLIDAHDKFYMNSKIKPELHHPKLFKILRSEPGYEESLHSWLSAIQFIGIQWLCEASDNQGKGK